MDNLQIIEQNGYIIKDRLSKGRANIVFLVEKDASNFIAKFFLKDRIQKYYTEMNILKLLNEKKSTFAPKYIETIYGTDMIVVIQEFIKGQLLSNYYESSIAKSKIINQLIQLKIELSKIEIENYGYISGITGQSESWFSFISRSAINDDAIFLQWNDILDKSDLNVANEIFQKHKELIKSREKKHVLNHGDFTPLNIIYGTDHSLYLVDWELAVSGDPLFDISWQINQENETTYWDFELKEIFRQFRDKFKEDFLKENPSLNTYEYDALINIYRICITLRTLRYWIGRDSHRIDLIKKQLIQLISTQEY